MRRETCPAGSPRPGGGREKSLPWIAGAAFAVAVCLVPGQARAAAGQEKDKTAAALTLKDDSDARAAKRKVPPPANAPRGYKGVLLADLNPKNAYKDEIIADIGSLGLWILEQMTWTQISGTDPDWVMAVALGGGRKKELIVDQGAKGLWKWSHDGYPGVWTQISGDNAAWAIALDDDNDKRQELHVVFGAPPGVWRYDETDGRRAWKQISPFNPHSGLRTAMIAGGPEAGNYCFPGKGLWTISFADGEVRVEQLSGTETDGDDNASAAFKGGPAEDLVVDFAGRGLWFCENTTYDWHKLDGRSPDRLLPVRFGGAQRALLDFNGDPGLYFWTFGGFPGTLTRLHPADPDAGFCEVFERDEADRKNSDQQLAVDFGKSGVWTYDFTRKTWALIDTRDPVFMASGDYWGLGFNSTLAVSFATEGLWLYEAKSGNWFQVSNNAPDSGL